jgi:hypothetical protein
VAEFSPPTGLAAPTTIRVLRLNGASTRLEERQEHEHRARTRGPQTGGRLMRSWMKSPCSSRAPARSTTPTSATPRS